MYGGGNDKSIIVGQTYHHGNGNYFNTVGGDAVISENNIYNDPLFDKYL